MNLQFMRSFGASPSNNSKLSKKFVELFKWHTFSYNKDLLFISADSITYAVDDFWKHVMSKVSIDQHVLFIARIRYDNSQMVSLGKMQKISYSDQAFLTKFLCNVLSMRTDEYNSRGIEEIIFDYLIRDGKIDPMKSISKKEVPLLNYYRYKIPSTFDPYNYGTVLDSTPDKTIVSLKSGNLAIVNSNGDTNKVSIFKGDDLVLTYTDVKTSDNSFIRVIGRNTYHYHKEQLILVQSAKKTKPIKELNIDTKLDDKVITMDLETRVDNDTHIPYCVGVFTGNEKLSFYLSDYKNSNHMLSQAIKSIFTSKYKNYKVYLHNLSNFDGIFLLKIMKDIGIIDPIINNGRIISLTLTLDNCKLTFLDSYQLLPSSLRSLAKSFGVEEKGIFPYKFLVNTNNDINYIGDVPDFKYFDGVSINEYDTYLETFKKGAWNLRDETIKYCLQDCISLYQVIMKFNSEIFNLFSVNATKYSTLPSLSFAIFRTKFLPKDLIHQLSAQFSNFIRESYTGGSVDAYSPSVESKFYCFDINSLYPYCMGKYAMPIGSPTHFYGDILKLKPDAFGFFNCIVHCPKDLVNPIIQIHHKTSAGIRTIAGTGTFKAMLFSEEIKNAMNYGYTFEILGGYTFARANVFSKFINSLYSMRLQYSKANPLNLVAKLLLNSLYGRFGMKDSFNDIFIMNKEEYNNYIYKNSDSIVDFIDLDDSIMIFAKDKEGDIETLINGLYESHNINVAIASAITAYARIEMSRFKNNPNFTLHYSDTDSAYISSMLPESDMSNTILGKMKLEHICTRGIFLAPKVYCLVTEDGQFISRVKGLTKDVTLSLSDFESLLIENSSILRSQTKWFKDLGLGSISIKDQLYTLQATSNKRHLVYKDGVLIGTKSIDLTTE